MHPELLMSHTFLRPLRIIVAVAVVFAGADLALAQKGGKPDTGPGTSTAARKYLEGRWSLLSFEVFPPGKAPVQVTGGQGSLTYDGFGNLQIEIRVPANAVEPLRLAGVPTNGGVMSLKGRTAIDMQKRTLTYFIEGQPAFGAPSGPLALNRTRYWEVEGRVLTLTTKSDDGQPLSVGKWEKMQ
jgi:hypothetical protein